MKVPQREGGADSQEPVAKCLPDVVMTSRGATGHVSGFLMTAVYSQDPRMWHQGRNLQVTRTLPVFLK